MAPPAARPIVSESCLYLGPASCTPDDFESVAGLDPGDGAGANSSDGTGVGAVAGACAGIEHAEISTIASNMGTKVTKNFQWISECDFFIMLSPFIRFLYIYTDDRKKYYIKYSKKCEGDSCISINKYSDYLLNTPIQK